MIPDIYEVTKIQNGILYVMPRPSSEWLEEDVKYFSKLDINVVVSLLEEAEEFELQLSKEKTVLESFGIEFVSHPIQDRGLPNPIVFSEFVSYVYNKMADGQNIAIHCRAGIGRTGILSSCLLKKDGYEAQIAIDMVSAARGVQIPDTTEQFNFICDFNSGVSA